MAGATSVPQPPKELKPPSPANKSARNITNVAEKSPRATVFRGTVSPLAEINKRWELCNRTRVERLRKDSRESTTMSQVTASTVPQTLPDRAAASAPALGSRPPGQKF